MIDVALLVPFEGPAIGAIDPLVRRSHSPSFHLALEARRRLEDHVGRSLKERTELPDAFGDDYRERGHRSLTAITLATALERAGLGWRVVDPGIRTFDFWRDRIARLRSDPPRLVAVTTTFVTSAPVAATLCAMVRELLPGARLALGGYLYATDVKRYLALDADILCVGEGEVRLVEIARAIRDGRSLEPIRGLYLRRPDRSLVFTGAVEQMPLEEIPAPDWTLADRIDPPLRLSEQPIDYHVETQRGCVFKCEFCTYRTISAPAERSIERAVDVILDAGRHGPGRIWVVDATGSFPRDRFRAVLERLLARGGSALPIAIFARVSDLDDEICALMARAGVTHLNVGQESGSQRLLNGMKKGTRVDQVRPAIQSMSRFGIRASFNFLFGFPGEDEGTLAETREMMTSLNADCPTRPAVPVVLLDVFSAQDFASVSRREDLAGSSHFFDWGASRMQPHRIAEEILHLCVAMSRVPHAPITGFGYGVAPTLGGLYWMQTPYGETFDRAFAFGKAVDRGIAQFVEEIALGKSPDARELRRVREIILGEYPQRRSAERIARRVMRRGRHVVESLLSAELRREAGGAAPGPFTRLHLARMTFGATGSLASAARAVLRGEFPALGSLEETDPSEVEEKQALAVELVDIGIRTGKARRKRSPPAATPAAA